MLNYTEEDIEALASLARSHGLKVFLREMDDVINIMKDGFLSVPLDKDPQTSAMKLLQERYKVEGAEALKQRLLERLKKIKENK